MDEVTQESSFMNATLQGSETVAFSIATHIEVPSWVPNTEEDVANHIFCVLTDALRKARDITFEVEIGPGR